MVLNSLLFSFLFFKKKTTLKLLKAIRYVHILGRVLECCSEKFRILSENWALVQFRSSKLGQTTFAT